MKLACNICENIQDALLLFVAAREIPWSTYLSLKFAYQEAELSGGSLRAVASRAPTQSHPASYSSLDPSEGLQVLLEKAGYPTFNSYSKVTDSELSAILCI